MGSGVLKTTGSFKGTGAEQTIPLDFAPRHVKVVNKTSHMSGEAMEGMTDGGEKTITDGTQSAMTAGEGITFLDEEAIRDGAYGFKVGTTDAVNKADDEFWFIATE